MLIDFSTYTTLQCDHTLFFPKDFSVSLVLVADLSLILLRLSAVQGGGEGGLTRTPSV